VAETPDHYAALGLAPDAEPQAVAAAYRRLARVHHPDVSQQPDAAERMRALNAAYWVLSDEERRAAYDARRTKTHSASGSGLATATHVRRAPPTHSEPTSSTSTRAAPTPAMRATNVIGMLCVGLLVGFVALACVLSSRLPTSAGPGGIQVMGRATATALARPASTAPPTPSLAPAPATTAVAADSVLVNHPVLRAFQRPVLVPPPGLAPFGHLTLQARQISGTACGTGDLVCVPRYDIQYGNVRSGGARLSAFGGRSGFDSAAPPALACPAASLVCNVPGRAGGADVTYVLDLRIRQQEPGIARLQACCPGPFWLLVWYDAATDTTYRLELSGAATELDETDGASSEATEAGVALASLASALVRLR
jgi:DnaJ domain